MLNGKKENKKFWLNKLLILLGLICVVFATLIIGFYLDNAQISIFAKSANQIKESYASTESNTWDISATENDSVTATLDENGLLTISGTGNMKEFEYDNQSDVPWDSVREQIKNIEIENGVTNISGFIFVNCENLNNVEISNTITSIGNIAFGNCYSLINIDIPSSVTSIGVNPFSNCQNLTNINVDSNNMNYKDENGVLYTKDNTQLIVYPEGKQKTEYTIVNGTTTICEGAFGYCEKLSTIKIPNSVTNIERAAFFECTNLTNIEIPSGVKNIKDMTFCFCESLTSVKIPNGLTSIGYAAFEDCYSLESIEIPNTVTSIGDYAFCSCENLIDIKIPSSVTEIGEDAFYGCKIINLITPKNSIIELPDVLKRAKDENDILYSNEFSYTNCTIEDNKIKIDDEASYGKILIRSGKLENLTYIISYNTWDISEAGDGSLNATLDENGLMKITGNGNMKDFGAVSEFPWYEIKTLIRNIKIEEGATNLKLYGFNYCYNLKSIEIPSTVVSLGEDVGLALEECNELTDIIVNSNNTKYSDDNGVLYTKDKKELIKYPAGKRVEEYKILEGVESIGKAAFIRTYFLKNLEIPSTLKSIGNYAFYNCHNLKNVTILDGATIIGEGAFYNCDDMTILCKQNSYAETYAKENEIPYRIIYLTSTEQEIDEINLMIKNIQPRTTVQEFKNDLQSETSYVILDSKGNTIQNASTVVVTGCKIKLEDNTIYTIVVTGDADGDGQADIKDILAINKHRLNKANLAGEYLLAGDVNGDEVADIKDILQINKFRLGKTVVL